jgi:DNA-binding response OmpR family regulator
MKILVADKDKGLVQSMSSVLSDLGFEVIAAYDAVQAWTMIVRTVPAAVVLDLTMPGGTGTDVLQRIRRSNKVASIPVLVLASSADPTAAAQVKSLGAGELLLKPFSNEEFAARIRAMLPLAVTAQVASGNSPHTERRGASVPRVLVADDDAMICGTLDVMLREWGYEVICAPDGTEAWRVLVAPNPPHIAILDWLMPGMEGIKICKRVRAEAHDCYTYIILLTAKSTKASLIEGMEAGADDYIIKPFDLQELRVRLAAARRIVELQEDLLIARGHMRQALAQLGGARQ